MGSEDAMSRMVTLCGASLEMKLSVKDAEVSLDKVTIVLV